MKKIAVNTRLLIPEKMDGIGRFSYETLIRICKAHPEIEFTFLFDREPPQLFSFPPNVSLVKLFPSARIPILWFWWFEISVRSFINKKKFDLFLSPEGWVPGGLNCKSLGIIHDLNFEHFPENIKWSHRIYLKYFFPKYAKRASRIASVSAYSKKDISETYSIPESNIDVLYNGANNEFKPISKEEKRAMQVKYAASDSYFLFIGTIHPRKNLEHLFLAYDLFRETNDGVKLLIAGNRKWWPKSLEDIYQKMHYKSDVIFLGRQSDQELANLLAGALALTYLPYFEGFGIPIIEAFQSGTPVICSNVTSMPEVAEEAALLCDPRNTEEIASTMHELANDSKLQDLLVEKGLKRAAFFNWEKSAELLYQSMVKTYADA